MPNQISKYNRFFTDHKRNRKLPRTTVHRHKMKKIKHKLLKNDVLLLNNSFDQRSEEVLADSASTPFEVTIENEEIFANVAGSNEQQSSIEHDFIFSNEDNLFNINLQELEEDDQVNYISTSLLALFFA
jgi:hypothetical protein